MSGATEVPYSSRTGLVRETLQDFCEDCISREEALDQLGQSYNILDATDRIKEMRSVIPGQKTGKWLHKNDDHFDWCECPFCEYGSDGEVELGNETPYCPMCGAHLEG